MIRVLHVLGSLNRGGSETMLMNLYRHIDRTKVQFDFVIHTDIKGDYVNEIIELGGIIYSMPKYNGMNHFEYMKSWNDFFKKHSEYKIIHGHMRSTAAIYLSIAKKHGLFTIAHSHSTSSGNGAVSRIKTLMQFPVRYIADYFFGCSKEAGIWYFGNKIVQSSKFRILRNAIDIEKYIYSYDSKIAYRKEFGINNQFVVGHIGRFTEPKNHKFIIDIFNEIHKRNNDSILLLVGDGELKSSIKEKVDNLNLSNHVIFAGVREDVPQLLSAMDVFLFPSLFEGLGIVAIEAQASGLQVVCSDTIPKGVKLTTLVDFISLNQNAEEWAKVVLSHNDGYKRLDTSNLIKSSGYDINISSKQIQNFYFKVSERRK